MVCARYNICGFWTPGSLLCGYTIYYAFVKLSEQHVLETSGNTRWSEQKLVGLPWCIATPGFENVNISNPPTSVQCISTGKSYGRGELLQMPSIYSGTQSRAPEWGWDFSLQETPMYAYWELDPFNQWRYLRTFYQLSSSTSGSSAVQN